MTANPKAPKRPARLVCPRCAIDDEDFLTWEAEAPGVWRYTCTYCRPLHSFLTTTMRQVDEKEGEGVAHEFGVYDTLLELFSPNDPYLEWGIVEHRFAGKDAATYRELVRRYSHTVYGPTHYSVSAFLGLAAGTLARQSHLALKWVDATGYWHYNGQISAFCLAPAVRETVLSWEAFAKQQGFQPGDWPALDFRSGSPGPAGRLVLDESWQPAFGSQWFKADQLGYLGRCGWNHTRVDDVPATRHIVVEDRAGTQMHYAICDECRAAVRRYAGEAT